MYRVEWIDFSGKIIVVRGFKTLKDAFNYIDTHQFDEDEYPIVLDDSKKF